jgi:hypothetical protein
MGYSRFDRVVGKNGLFVGPKGSEIQIAGADGKFIPNIGSGRIFYVSSVTGNNGNTGLTWDKALGTIEAAIAKCTANRGDVIIIGAGHNEGITTAAEIDFDVAGITVIGLGTGSLKPTIDFDHADASVAIGADNVTLRNIRFRVSANAVTVGLDIEDGADYAHIDGCEFGYAETATDEFAIALRTNDASNYALIENCLFDAGAQAAVTAISFVKDTEGTIVRNNIFRGAYSTACINGTTTLSTNLLIENNLFYQGATEPAIELLTNSTGVIRDNDIKTNLATMAAAIVADACYLFRNYYNEDVNPGTGAVIGTASADD